MAERSVALATIGFALLMLGGVLLFGTARPTPHRTIAATEPVNYRIDPNSADIDELSLLPEIGPGIARRIVNDRQANGPFLSAGDMQRVPYVGEKTTAAISPWVRFDDGEH